MGHFARPSRPSDGNAAKRVHQVLPRSVVVGAPRGRQLIDQSNGTIRLDPAWRNSNHADALGLTSFDKPLL